MIVSADEIHIGDAAAQVIVYDGWTDQELLDFGAKVLIMSIVSVHLFSVLFSLSMFRYHGQIVI